MATQSNNTIDPDEKSRFEKYSRLWWDLDGPFWPLHGMNQLRTDLIREQLQNQFGIDSRSQDTPLKGLRILDIGCGGGILSEVMARLGAEVHGIDMVEKNIGIARLHADQSGLDIDYRCCTVEDLCLEPNIFDVVLNMEVIEHVKNPDLFLHSAANLVRPGGLMFIATLNRTWLSYLLAIVAAEHILKLLPKGTHKWRKFQRPDEVISSLGAYGFVPVNLSGVWINPFKRTFRRVPLTAVNYMLTFSNGMATNNVT